jgi:hypothetical protein
MGLVGVRLFAVLRLEQRKRIWTPGLYHENGTGRRGRHRTGVAQTRYTATCWIRLWEVSRYLWRSWLGCLVADRGANRIVGEMQGFLLQAEMRGCESCN